MDERNQVKGVQETAGLGEFGQLFRQHLKEYHHVETDKEFGDDFIKGHLAGRHTLIPVSIFSDKKLSALEAIVKYLRENESLRNADVAQLLGRSPASVWITYRNAAKKLGKKIQVSDSEIFIPTDIIASGRLSVLESVSMHLHETYHLSYRKIGELLQRDERTIWTVCSRARKKGVAAK